MTNSEDRRQLTTSRLLLLSAAFALVLSWAQTTRGEAQSSGSSSGQYPLSGTSGRMVPAGGSALSEFGRIEGIEARIRNRLDSARYRWGAVLVTPVYGLPTLAVNANCNAGAILGGDPDDEIEFANECNPSLVARVGVGLFLDLPVSKNWVFEVGGGPSYTWWQDDESRSGFRTNFTAGMHGLFNRMTLSLVATTSEREEIASSEFVNTTIVSSNNLRLDTMVQLSDRMDWWVGLEANESRHDEGLDDDQSELVSRLDVDSTVIRTGVRLHGARASVGALASLRKDEFPDETEDRNRDNTRGTLALELRTGWRHVSLATTVGVTSIEGDEGSSLSDPTEIVGWLDLTWRRQRWSTGLYGGRGVDYSVTSGAELFTEDRIGAFVAVDAKWDLNFRLFVEDRNIDYLEFQDPEIEDPKTETNVLGLTVQLPEAKGLRTSVSIIHDDTVSTLTGFDRKVTYITGSLALKIR